MDPEKEILPPNAVDDERMFVASVLQDRQAFLDSEGELYPSEFYDMRNAVVYDRMLKRESKGEPTDAISVIMSFSGEDRNRAMELNQLEVLPSAWRHSANKIREAAQRRKIIQGCGAVDNLARNGHSIAAVVEKAETLLSVDVKQPPIFSGHDASLKMVADLERRYNLKEGELSGITSGFSDLDEMTEGWQQGDMIVIGARPSIGKTALGLMFFCHSVFHSRIPALFYSLEMSTEAVMRRMLAIEKRASLKRLRKGRYSEAEFRQISLFSAECKKAPMHIVDATGPSIAEVCTTIRRAHRKHGVKLVVIDYLQKIKAVEKSEKRTYEVAEVSSKLKGVAKQLGISIVALAQLNREPEKDKGRTPRLTDLADSAQIERDADLVALLHRDRSESVGEATLFVAKQRDGEVGVVNLTFIGEHGRFEQAAPPSRVDPEDAPREPYADA